MHFDRINPRDSLKDLIKEIWVFEDVGVTPHSQKIIPDGFSEIIIHYGKPYKINLSGKWELQSRYLFSSQISKFFHLKNTGSSGMIGLKLHPTTFYEIFRVGVDDLTDKVSPLQVVLANHQFTPPEGGFSQMTIPEKVAFLENWLEGHQPEYQLKVRAIVRNILDHHGMMNVDHIANDVGISLRHAERLFKKVVGVTPKFFSRIVRFNHIFKIMEAKNESWVKVALQSGYFDQSHFIKNFKEFTGEEPSNYGFDEQNLANFFLRE